MADTTRDEALRRAIETCIRADADSVARLGELLTDDVSVWSPNLFTTSLAELQAYLAYRESAFSDLDLQIDALDVFGNKGFAEYRVSAVFSGPFLIDDGIVLEPNGEVVLLGAAVVAEFEGGKISALRNYFDDATLLEQMLPA